MNPSFHSRSLREEQAACLHLGAVTNTPAVKLMSRISCRHTGPFLWEMPGSSVVQPMVCVFRCSRNCQMASQSSCTVLHSHQRSRTSGFCTSLPALDVVAVVLLPLFQVCCDIALNPNLYLPNSSDASPPCVRLPAVPILLELSGLWAGEFWGVPLCARSQLFVKHVVRKYFPLALSGILLIGSHRSTFSISRKFYLSIFPFIDYTLDAPCNSSPSPKAPKFSPRSFSKSFVVSRLTF